MIYLRPATKRDVVTLFELRNDPDAYKNFLNPNPVSWDEHLGWFANVLRNENNIVYMIYNKKKQEVGMLRFDINKGVAKISINIGKKFRGKHYGTEALRVASRIFLRKYKTVNKILAQIKKDNILSIVAFVQVGYKLVGQEKDLLKFVYSINQ